MYELIQVGDRTFYIDCPAKAGVWLTEDSQVCLIDSGSDRDAGKKILKILDSRGWRLRTILNTHAHADHIGGNRFLQERTGCSVFAAGADRFLMLHPIALPSFLFGGYPPKELRNKFLMAQPCGVQELTAETLPRGISAVRLDGHSLSMSAFRTEDGVWFLGDSLTSAELLDKYPVTFLYDPRGYVESLRLVRELEGVCFVPAHAPAVTDIRPLAEANLARVEGVVSALKEICSAPQTFDDLLAAAFRRWNITMNFVQHALVGSTLKAYLAWLHDRGEMEVFIRDNRLFWQTA